MSGLELVKEPREGGNSNGSCSVLTMCRCFLYAVSEGSSPMNRLGFPPFFRRGNQDSEVK